MSTDVIGEMNIFVAGERMTLRTDRSLFWAGTLFVADVHVGKAEVFRQRGLPVPEGDLARDLDRLSVAMAQTGAERLVVLGDLIHGPIAPAVRAAVSTWRTTHDFPALLAAGNHDRHDVLPPEWRFEVAMEWADGPFVFCHDPQLGGSVVRENYVWAGHLHPGVTLRGRGDTLRVPCFHVGERVGVLPAFGSFTGHGRLPRTPGDRVIAIVGGELVVVGARH